VPFDHEGIVDGADSRLSQPDMGEFMGEREEPTGRGTLGRHEHDRRKAVDEHEAAQLFLSEAPSRIVAQNRTLHDQDANSLTLMNQLSESLCRTRRMLRPGRRAVEHATHVLCDHHGVVPQ